MKCSTPKGTTEARSSMSDESEAFDQGLFMDDAPEQGVALPELSMMTTVNEELSESESSGMRLETFSDPGMGQPTHPYGQQPYGAPPPHTIHPAPAPIVVNQQPRLFAVEPPPGAPPGGVYQEERYIGVATLLCCLLLLFFFWPATCAPFCCPCDQRTVYIYAGAKYTRSGQMVPAGPEFCGHPCLGPAM